MPDWSVHVVAGWLAILNPRVVQAWCKHGPIAGFRVTWHSWRRRIVSWLVLPTQGWLDYTHPSVRCMTVEVAQLRNWVDSFTSIKASSSTGRLGSANCWKERWALPRLLGGPAWAPCLALLDVVVLASPFFYFDSCRPSCCFSGSSFGYGSGWPTWRCSGSGCHSWGSSSCNRPSWYWCCSGRPSWQSLRSGRPSWKSLCSGRPYWRSFPPAGSHWDYGGHCQP